MAAETGTAGDQVADDLTPRQELAIEPATEVLVAIV